jgi:hypothetical protein
MTLDEFRGWVASRKVAAATIDVKVNELAWCYWLPCDQKWRV